jgi:hypothetical protein
VFLYKETYIGLIFGCSKNKEEKNCPLLKIRQLKNKEERFNWWKLLSESEKNKIIKFHKKCINNG